MRTLFLQILQHFRCYYLFCSIFFSFFIVSLFPVDTSYAERLIPVHVEKGKGLIHIARDYCISRDVWVEIAEINKLSPPYMVKAGSTILIPYSLLLTDGLKAQVAYISGSVEIMTHDRKRHKLNVGDQLIAGQSILTGPNSYAQLIFPGNKYTRIEPNSQLIITYLFKFAGGLMKTELFLKKGHLIHKVENELHQNETFETKTAVSITGIKGTEFRMKMPDGDTNIIETLKGRVQLVDNNNHEIILKKREGVMVKKGEIPQPPKALPSPPKIPSLEKIYHSLPIVFKTSDNQKNESIRLRLTSDEEGQLTIFEQKVAPGKDFLIESLKDSTYFAFFTAFDKEGFESTDSEPIPLVLRTLPVAPVVNYSNDKYISWEGETEIQWHQTEGAETYFIELAKDDTFSDIVESRYTSKTNMIIPFLPEGTYFFRARSIAADGFSSKFSRSLYYQIIKQPQMKNIEISSEPNNHILSWPAIKKNCTYDVQISADKEFGEIVQSQTALTQNRYTVFNDHAPGKYYVRIRATLENSLPSKWTEAQEMVIKSAPFGWGAVLPGVFLIIAALL